MRFTEETITAINKRKIEKRREYGKRNSAVCVEVANIDGFACVTINGKKVCSMEDYNDLTESMFYLYNAITDITGIEF